jgi:hypothetical protein
MKRLTELWEDKTLGYELASEPRLEMYIVTPRVIEVFRITVHNLIISCIISKLHSNIDVKFSYFIDKVINEDTVKLRQKSNEIDE